MFDFLNSKLGFKLPEDELPKWQAGVKTYKRKYPDSKLRMDLDMTSETPLVNILATGSDELFLLGLEIGNCGGEFKLDVK